MKIGVLLADAFQDSEYFLPKFEIESAGAQTEVISSMRTVVRVKGYRIVALVPPRRKTGV